MLFLETKGYNYSKQRCERITSWFVGQYLPRYKLLINIDHLGLLRQEVFGWMWAAGGAPTTDNISNGGNPGQTPTNNSVFRNGAASTTAFGSANIYACICIYYCTWI